MDIIIELLGIEIAMLLYFPTFFSCDTCEWPETCFTINLVARNYGYVILEFTALSAVSQFERKLLGSELKVLALTLASRERETTQ